MAQKTVLQMVHHSETMTEVNWVVMKVQMKVDDSEMMTAWSLAQKTVLQMVHHSETMTEVNWVVMKVQMKVDDSEMMRDWSLSLIHI